MKADVLSLARLICYSKEEALRLGMSVVVIECLRMAGIELAHLSRRNARLEAPKRRRRVRMN